MATTKQLRSRGGRKGKHQAAPQTPPRGENEAALQGLNTLQGSATSTPKAPTAVYTKVVQAEPKTVTQKIQIPKDILNQALKLAEEFHSENIKLDEYKSLTEQTRNSMSEFIFKIAKLSATTATAEHLRLATFDELCTVVETGERQRYAKAHGLEVVEDVAVKDALGSSWRTYKAQCRKGIHAGYNPNEFSNSTAFRSAGSPPTVRGTKARGRGKGGIVAGTEQAAPEISLVGGKTMHDALVHALNECIAAAKDTDPDDQIAAANILTAAALEVQKLLSMRTLARAKERAGQQPPAETGATASL